MIFLLDLKKIAVLLFWIYFLFKTSPDDSIDDKDISILAADLTIRQNCYFLEYHNFISRYFNFCVILVPSWNSINKFTENCIYLFFDQLFTSANSCFSQTIPINFAIFFSGLFQMLKSWLMLNLINLSSYGHMTGDLWEGVRIKKQN